MSPHCHSITSQFYYMESKEIKDKSDNLTILAVFSKNAFARHAVCKLCLRFENSAKQAGRTYSKLLIMFI